MSANLLRCRYLVQIAARQRGILAMAVFVAILLGGCSGTADSNSSPSAPAVKNTTQVEVCSLITSVQITQAFNVDQSNPLIADPSTINPGNDSKVDDEQCEYDSATEDSFGPMVDLFTCGSKDHFDTVRGGAERREKKPGSLARPPRPP
ncbi:MAG: hypothetical protein ABI206_13755 [Antricoccus sp.]